LYTQKIVMSAVCGLTDSDFVFRKHGITHGNI